MSELQNDLLIEHENMFIRYVNSENGLKQLSFNPEKTPKEPVQAVPFPNFEVAVAGRPYGHASALVSGLTNLPSEMVLKDIKTSLENVQFTYIHPTLGLRIQVDMQLIPGSSVIRQQTTAYNDSQAPIVLTHLSSMCMQGIATDGCRPWHHSDKIKVHYCLQTWNGEGQWRSGSLEELGLYPTSTHPSSSTVHFSSIGTWSTGRYLPMAIIEDLETSKTWYFQIEASSDWQFEIGHRGSWTDEKGALFIHADGADERNGGWTKTLAPGESFTSIPVAFGCCKGDLTAAVKELTSYRRYILKQQYLDQRLCPIVYNDYMNTLWGNPTREKLIPLIDSASEAGCEYFCIDAGWFGGKEASWGDGLGDWNPSDDRFGEDGLQGVLEYIKLKNMHPGLWLEMEVCGEKAELAKKPDAWFIQRYGVRIGGGARWFLNYENADVRSYMHHVIERLVAMGVRFIKNDYNLGMNAGDERAGLSASESLMNSVLAFYRFIDEVRSRHPDLILENCGSGAMRSDYGVLSHFHMQSSSDQEDYTQYPSILGGSLAAVLPEQLGIWAYPYPLLHGDIAHPERMEQGYYMQSMQDGEQTIFNMINGMCGSLYLSGHLNYADPLNKALIHEAVSLYKKEREHIQSSYPLWPLGFTRINAKNSWACVGLSSCNNDRILLAVWRLGSSEAYQTLPLQMWQGKSATVKQIYPSQGYESQYYYNEAKGCLTVHLDKTYQARYYEIRYDGIYFQQN
ncbi:alpha-galactosidase [Cohnella endophytica]|uniref:Alpha-galactosidase n=1 Tax=Cohnella endophytica TaxID=2419778 RepID=A0A494XQI7_9BACL|nr:glycoside hydrolase family 36 protein [Cohnella endophytica]RKP52895.1 alpha-galactosidase [Cohnella endophytica]